MKHFLKKYLIKELEMMSDIHINSPVNSIPNILNLSFITINNQDFVNKLVEKEIYLSTTSACSLKNIPSKSVLAITGSKELASNSLRISLSHLTTKDEIDKFLKEFRRIYKELS